TCSRSRSLTGESTHVAPEEELGQLVRRLAHRLEILDAGAAPLGVARAQRGRDHGVQQPGLPVGRGAERAQVPRRDAVARQRLARCRDVGVVLGVDALPALDPRLEEAEFLQLARAARIDAGALA